MLLDCGMNNKPIVGKINLKIRKSSELQLVKHRLEAKSRLCKQEHSA